MTWPEAAVAIAGIIGAVLFFGFLTGAIEIEWRRK